MSDRQDRPPDTDDGLPWGHIDAETGVWWPVPKGPGLVDLGPPPFDVTLWDGRVRHIVHEPEDQR